MFKNILGPLLMLSLCSCASKFFVPGNRFLSPEGSGKFMHGDVKTGGIGVTSVQVADDITLAAPDTTPKLEKNSAGFVGLQLGLINHLDIYADSTFGGPMYAGVKVQLLGDPFIAAKEGNFSLSVAGGIVSGDNLKSATANDIQYKAVNNFSGYELLAIAGYRPSDWTLIYVSPFKTHLTAKTSIEKTAAGVVTKTAQPDGNGDMTGAAVGLRFGKYFFGNGEISWTEMKWKRTNPSELESAKFSNVALGVAIGGAW